MIQAAAHHYCFSCGVEVRELASDRLYLCDPCRGRQEGPDANRFTIKPLGSTPMGPFSHERVVEQIERGVVDANDLVSEGLGRWTALSQHAEFLVYFIPGDPHHARVAAVKGNREAQRSEVRRRELGLKLGLVVVVAASIGAVFVTVQNRLFILPEEVTSSVEASVEGFVDVATRAVRKAADEDYAAEELRETTELPGEEAVEMAKSLWRQPQGVASERLEKAWNGLAMGTRAGAELARSQAEQALVQDPRGAGPAAALAVSYAVLARSEPELGRHSVSLLQRAQAVDSDSHEVLRASAGVGVANRAFMQAAESANACLRSQPDDTVCSWYLGEAQLGLGNFELAESTLLKAAETSPEAEGLYLALGRASMELQHYARAEPLLRDFVDRHGDDAPAQAALARFCEETGQLAEAREHASRAYELDEALIEAGLLAGQLLLHVEGKPAEARDLLVPLARRADVARHRRNTTFLVHASHAARMAGDAVTAESLAAQALEIDRGYAPAHLAMAEARLKLGDASGAEESLKAGEVSVAEGPLGGRYHYRTGMIYLDMDQARIAQQGMGDAVAGYPDWLAARLGLALVYLRLDNSFLAVEAFTKGFEADLDRPGRQHPVSDVMLTELGTEQLGALVREKLAGDARMNRYVPRALGVLDAYECITTGQQCDRAERWLLKALEIDDGDTTAHAWLGRLSLRKGDYEDAYNRLTRVIASAGDSPMVNAMRAQALYGMGRVDEGEETFRRALQGASQTPGVHRLRGDSLASAGQLAAAVAAYRRVLELDPSDLQSRVTLLELQRAVLEGGG